MTKKKRLAFFLSLILISITFLILRISKNHEMQDSPLPLKTKRHVFIKPSIDIQSPAPQANDNDEMEKRPWEENFIENLKIQGGDELSSIDYVINERRSWPIGEVKIPVVLATLKLKRVNGVETKVDVMIDEKTGKIIQSWNAPIIDAANPREEFRLKLTSPENSENSRD